MEGLVWLGSRLFSVGLDCNVVEYDLASLQLKVGVATHIVCTATNKHTHKLNYIYIYTDMFCNWFVLYLSGAHMGMFVCCVYILHIYNIYSNCLLDDLFLW